MAEAWIIDAVRTPRGRGKKGRRAFRDPSAGTLRAGLNALKTARLDPATSRTWSWDACRRPASRARCIARMAVLAAGWPIEATGVTLNRFCGSGLQAVNFAAMGVMAGQQDLVVGGGVESMSRVPMGADGGGLDGNNRHLRELHPLVPQGISADLIATLEGFAPRGLRPLRPAEPARVASSAIAEGRFEKSLVPVNDLDGKLVLDHDEYPRARHHAGGAGEAGARVRRHGRRSRRGRPLTFDQMACSATRKVEADQPRPYAPATRAESSTAPAAVLLASPEYARAHGMKPRARIRATATTAPSR